MSKQLKCFKILIPGDKNRTSAIYTSADLHWNHFLSDRFPSQLDSCSSVQIQETTTITGSCSQRRRFEIFGYSFCVFMLWKDCDSSTNKFTSNTDRNWRIHHVECELHCYSLSLPDFQAYQYQEEDEMQRELRKQRDLLDQDSSVRNAPSPSGSSPSPGPGISYIQSEGKGGPTVVYVTGYGDTAIYLLSEETWAFMSTTMETKVVLMGSKWYLWIHHVVYIVFIKDINKT